LYRKNLLKKELPLLSKILRRNPKDKGKKRKISNKTSKLLKLETLSNLLLCNRKKARMSKNNNQRRSKLRKRRKQIKKILLCMSKKRTRIRHNNRSRRRSKKVNRLRKTKRIRMKRRRKARRRARSRRDPRLPGTMKIRSQGSPECLRTSTLSTIMETGREVLPRCLSLWRLSFQLCLRSLWRSRMRLSSLKLKRLLRKTSKILELRWTINPRNSRKSLINFLPTKTNKTQIKKNLMLCSISSNHLLMLVKRSRSNKMQLREKS